MKTPLSWQYDEFKQVGKDYGCPTEVEVYDSSHADFRDLEAESNEVLDSLAIKPGDALIDFGSGTDTFAIQAASAAPECTLSMFSQAMLSYAKAKATREPG